MNTIMKRALRLLIGVSLFVSLVLALTYCGGGGGGSSSPPPTPITNAMQATNAASSINQAANLGAGSVMIFSNLGSVGGGTVPAAPQFKAPKSMKLEGGTAIASRLSGKFAKSSAVKAVAAAVKKASVIISSGGAVPCAHSGSYSYDGTADDVTGHFSLDLTFTNCQEYDTELNGTYAITGAETSTAMTMTATLSGFSITEFTPDGLYTTPLASITITDLSFAANYSWDINGYYTGGAITANGEIAAIEGSTSYTLTYASCSASESYTSYPTYDIDTLTINGGVSEAWIVSSVPYAATVAFENLVFSSKIYTAASGTIEISDEEDTINGVITTSFSPDNYCFMGRFSVQTTVPVYWDESAGMTTDGIVIINGNTTLTFNSDGSVDVTFDGTTTSYVTEADLGAECEFGSL